MSTRPGIPRKAGLQKALIGYFQENADRVITLDELTRQFPEWARSSHSSAANILTSRFSDRMVKLGWGAWRWDSKDHTPPTEMTKLELLLIEVKRNEQGKILMRDTENNTLYVVTEFEF